MKRSISWITFIITAVSFFNEIPAVCSSLDNLVPDESNHGVQKRNTGSINNNDNTITETEIKSNGNTIKDNIETLQESDEADEQAAFCKGMYMTMFMDGFHFSLGRDKENPATCLNYFVRSWRLEDPGKFKGAMVFTFLLAILVESLSALRGVIIMNSKRRTRHILLILCYGVQGLMGYILMLISMSFSVELVLSVISGLMVGNALFMRYDEVKPPARTALTMLQTNQSVADNAEFQPLLNVSDDRVTAASLRRRA